MVVPLIIAGAGLALSAYGAASSANAQTQAGLAAEKTAVYNATVNNEVANYNANVVMDNAEYGAEAAMVNASKVRMEAQYSADALEKEAKYAAARTKYDIAKKEEQLYKELHTLGSHVGVQMDSGSVVSAAEDKVRNAVLDEQIIAYEGDMDVWRYREKGSLLLWSGEETAKQYEHSAASLLIQSINEANMLRWQGYTGASAQLYSGQATRAAAQTGATSTLLTGVGQTAMGALDVYEKFKGV